VLEPLSDMADRTRVAILTITHFSKTGAANITKALHRFIGSIAFTGAPRAAFAVIEDADDEGRHLFLHEKTIWHRRRRGSPSVSSRSLSAMTSSPREWHGTRNQ